jgi:DNA topoisomerase-3
LNALEVDGRNMAKLGNIVIVAEKPSVARDLARVVGAFKQSEGYFQGGGYTVTWAIGHLVTLPEPHQINPAWKAWSFGHLPMLPTEWPLMAVEKTRAQFEVVRRALSHCDEVICATDAGREGELIFRYIFELSKCRKPVRRLWISSLTTEAIQAGLRNLKPSSTYDPLADAARARSRADWLFGMNLSRAYALTTNEQLFVGRVQTPTLAMVVDRDLKIQNFKPEEYIVIEGIFQAPSGKYKGFYLGEKPEVSNPLSAREKRFPNEPKKVDLVLKRILKNAAKLASVDGKTVKQPSPLLYDLTELQRHCNRLFGFSAAQTLSLAQSLYERHKLISYPRTGSRHLSQSVAGTLPEIVKVIQSPYEAMLAESTGWAKLTSRFVDDAKVTDHHAIIPTVTPILNTNLSGDEKKVYDLICRRLLMAWQQDFVTAVTTVITEVDGLDLFKTQGTMVVDLGWKALDLKSRSKTQEPELPAGLEPGSSIKILNIESHQKRTEPPPHLTEATLLTGMETAGRDLEDRELAEFMQDSGLGTPATRSGIIEALLSRNYIERKNKSLIATPLGQKLIATVHPSVKSPELTARWEKMLSEIQNKKSTLKKFMAELEAEVSARIAEIAESPPLRNGFSREGNLSSFELAPTETLPIQKKRNVTPADQLQRLLKDHFGFNSFRASQETVCRAVTEGKDVLLVMPTGAGKSICYQVPGIARGGTTLVVSPLVALIEDQVAKLQSLKFSAERIHSGRSREESRTVCQKYLAGNLDFLFIAPERLSVPGFLEFLQKRRLSLIAIDEAHCISQWGHDFRPDYRILGERLKELRPTPVIALTATATPAVQNDICKQLGLTQEVRIIQGFRRTNISIEVAEFTPKDRPSIINLLLKREGRLPAIVYAPTRKKTDELTERLSGVFRVGSYHAGMPAKAREKVQTQFLANEIDVIVATVAFGMGIDKANIRTVIHAAMPGSIEGYYQEIGRAGRDGLPSTAYLLHSYADQKTHEFFFEMNYPDISHLQAIFDKMTSKKAPKASIQKSLPSMDSEIFDRALEQLWVHRGVAIDPDESLSLGSNDWKKSYQLQRDLKKNQLKQMLALTSSGKCRMMYMVSHFGDQSDSGKPCGNCDICNPIQPNSLVKKRSLSQDEIKAVTIIMSSISTHSGLPSGKLFQALEEAKIGISRPIFENLMTLLEKNKWIESKETSFEKDGRNITYRNIFIRKSINTIAAQELSSLQISSMPRADIGRKSLKKNGRKDQSKKGPFSVRPLANKNTVGILDPLKAWRLTQARKKNIPAFRILTDKALHSICEQQPHSITELLEISSINRKAIVQYGDDIIRIVRKFADGNPPERDFSGLV